MKKQILSILIILELIVACFSIDFILKVQDKKFVSYSVEEEYYETESISKGEQKVYPLKIINWNIQKYKFKIDTQFWKKGTAYCRILNAEGNIIREYPIEASGLKDDTVELSLGDLVLNTEEEYSLSIENISGKMLNIYVDASGNLKNEQVYLFGYKNLFIISCCMLNVIFVLSILIMYHIKSEKRTFLLLALLTGIIFMFVIPPYTAPDEMRHLARAYDIAQRNVICTSYETKSEFNNSTLPVCDFPLELFELKLVSENNGINYTRENNTKIAFGVFGDKIFQAFSGNMVEMPIHGDHTTSSIAFLPQSMGIVIAKIFHFSPWMMFYFARFMNLFVAILLAFVGFCVLPKYREIYTALYFAPGISFLRSTSSTDGFLYSLILLFVALIINIKCSEEKSFWNWKNLIPLAGILTAITLIKLPYLFIVVLLVFIDRKQFSVKKRESGWIKFLAIIMMFGIAFVIYYISHKLLDNNPNVISNVYASSTEISSDYIIYMIKNPIKVFNMLVQTWINNFGTYFNDAISLPNSECLMVPFLVWLFFIGQKGNNIIIFSKREKKLLFCFGMLMWGTVIAAFYFVGATPDLGYIWGLQGRYLYPVMPLLFISIAKEKGDKFDYSHVVAGANIFLVIHMIKILELYWI